MKRCVSLDSGEKSSAGPGAGVCIAPLCMSWCDIRCKTAAGSFWWDKRTRNKFLKDQTHYIIEFTMSVFISRAFKMFNIIGNEMKRSLIISPLSSQNVYSPFFKSTRHFELNACASYRSCQLQWNSCHWTHRTQQSCIKEVQFFRHDVLIRLAL